MFWFDLFWKNCLVKYSSLLMSIYHSMECMFHPVTFYVKNTVTFTVIILVLITVYQQRIVAFHMTHLMFEVSLYVIENPIFCLRVIFTYIIFLCILYKAHHMFEVYVLENLICYLHVIFTYSFVCWSQGDIILLFVPLIEDMSDQSLSLKSSS